MMVKEVDDGQPDFVSRVHRRPVRALAHAHVPDDVFDFDDGIIHQDSRHQRERGQRDLIEREIHPLHERERGDGGEGNGQRRNHGGPPIAQKQPDDDDGENRAFDQRIQRRMIGAHRVVDRVRYHFHVQRGRLGLDLAEFGLHRLEYGDIRCAFCLEHAERGGRPAVQARDAAHFLDAVVHVGYFPQAEGPSAAGHDLRIRQGFGRLRAAQDANGLFAAAHLGPAPRRIEIERPHLLVDLEGRQSQRLHTAGIELHPDLSADAAAARHLRHSGEGQKSLGDAAVDGPAELFGREGRGGYGVVRNGIAIDVDALHLRFHDSLGQLTSHFGHGIPHIGYGPIDGRADLKFDVDFDGTFYDVGDDVADVADAGDRAFHFLRNLRLHFRRRGSRLGDGDAHQGK